MKKVLAQALRESGFEVSLVPASNEKDSRDKDSRGEDGLFIINGRKNIIQIVSLPSDSELWREHITSGEAYRSGNFSDVVDWVRTALEHKANIAIGTLLVLDASHIGAIVITQLVDAYLRKYPNPVEEFGFGDIWIIGPTARSSVHLSPTT